MPRICAGRPRPNANSAAAQRRDVRAAGLRSSADLSRVSGVAEHGWWKPALREPCKRRRWLRGRPLAGHHKEIEGRRCGDTIARRRRLADTHFAGRAGKTWTSALHITPLGVSAVDGGSFDYSALAQEPMMDDPSVGGLLWAHQRPGAACNTNPPPAGCFEILFTRFALDF